MNPLFRIEMHFYQKYPFNPPIVNIKIAFIEFFRGKTHHCEAMGGFIQISLSHNVRYATLSPPLNRGYLDLKQRSPLVEVHQVNPQCLHRENPAHP